MIKLKDLRLNDSNPRFIRDDKFLKLVESLRKDRELLSKMPLKVDFSDNGKILGGNMRFRALIHLGVLEIKDNEVIDCSDLIEEQKKKLIALDNIPFGEWDYDILLNNWDSEELEGWGIDLPIDSKIVNGEVVEMGPEIELNFAEELTIGKEFLLVTFESEEQYEEVKALLKLKTVVENNLDKKHLNNTGTERVLLFKDLIARYENSNPIKIES